MQEVASSLLSAARWSGVAMIEFRVADDGRVPHEVNGPFWGSLQLAIDCGIDFPWLLLRSLPEPVSARQTIPSTGAAWLLGRPTIS